MRLLILGYVAFSLLPLSVCVNLSIKPEQDTISRPAGTSVVITCSSSVASSIKWLDTSGNEINNDYWDPRISLDVLNSSSKKLIITNTHNSDTGHYTCVGNVSGMLQEKSLKLIIFKGITFDSVPSFQHMVINTVSTIVCKVSGEIDPVVSWKFNREKVLPGGKYIKVPEGLQVVNVTENDAGLYTCSAEIDNAGLLESKTINVTIYVPPRIVRGVGKNEAVQGDDFNFTCHAEGFPTPIFEFYKVAENGLLVGKMQEDSRIIKRANNLMFKPAIKKDEGYYKCVAKNEAGANESAVGLFTVFVPARVVHFQDLTVNEGSIASMICSVEGDPSPQVSIGRSQVDAPYNVSSGRMQTRNLQANTYQFQIMDIKQKDSGMYFCIASNSFAKDIAYAIINVQHSPCINMLKTLPLVHVWADISKNLTIYFDSNPMPNITWYLGSTELKPNDTFKIFSGKNFSSLQVFVREIDQTWIYGEYKCTVINYLGQAEMYIELKRATIPSIPEVTLIKSHATDVWLELNPPKEDGGMPITGYVVQNQGTSYEFGLDKEIRITNLKPNTYYLFIVKAKNAVGAGIPQRIELHTKGISEPSIYIIKDHWEQSKPFDHRIFWKVNSSGGMPILEYEALYKKLAVSQVTKDDSDLFSSTTLFSHLGLEFDEEFASDFSSWSAVRVKDNLKHPLNNLVIRDLEPRSIYVLKLRARNAIGWSSFTNPATFITGEALQSELESRQSRKMPGLISIIIFLSISFLLVLISVIDVMCCYCCDRGLTKSIFSKCSKPPSLNNTKKQNSNLIDKQVHKEICTSSTCHTREVNLERREFKKKSRGNVCEPVPV